MSYRREYLSRSQIDALIMAKGCRLQYGVGSRKVRMHSSMMPLSVHKSLVDKGLCEQVQDNPCKGRITSDGLNLINWLMWLMRIYNVKRD